MRTRAPRSCRSTSGSSDPEQRRLIDLARPSVVVRPDEETCSPTPRRSIRSAPWAVVATSGTGGAPRLAQLSRAAVGSAVAGSLDALDASAYDPWVACLSPAHIGGLLVLLRGALHGLARDHPQNGSSRVRCSREAPDGAHVALVPTMLERLVRGGR